MVRPRLVEEGLPVGSDPNATNQIDQLLEEDMATNPLHYVDNDFSFIQSGGSSHPSLPVQEEAQYTPGSSSLLRALGGKLPPHRRQRRTYNHLDQPASHEYANFQVERSQMKQSHHHHYQPQFQHHAAPNPPVLTSSSKYSPHGTHFTIGGDRGMTMDSQNNQCHPTPPHNHQVAFSGVLPTPHPSQQSDNADHNSYSWNSSSISSLRRTPYHVEIGADDRVTERMQGVEVLDKLYAPLVVLDGANIAYAYGGVLSSSGGRMNSTTAAPRNGPPPHARGILVACRYFQTAGLRVLAVLPPTQWFRVSSQPASNHHHQHQSNNSNNIAMDHVAALLELHQQVGLLVSSPPTDDDDAYALTIAQRENVRAARRGGHGPAFVVSNDLFRDAQSRDTTGQLYEWLNHHNNNNSGDKATITNDHNDEHQIGPGRISFAFCDMGALDDHGDRELDFVPNPRHPLVEWIERNKVVALHQDAHV
jgi:hypothetical protein